MAEGGGNVCITRAPSLTERAVIQHVSHIYAQLDLPPSDDGRR